MNVFSLLLRIKAFSDSALLINQQAPILPGLGFKHQAVSDIQIYNDKMVRDHQGFIFPQRHKNVYTVKSEYEVVYKFRRHHICMNSV